MARVLIQVLLLLFTTYFCRAYAQERSPTAGDSRGASLEGRVSEARAKSSQLSPKDREAVMALFASAFQVYRANNHVAARNGFEDGLARDPANGIAQFYLAEILMRLGEQREARVRYEMAAALVPTAPEGLKARAALAGLVPASRELMVTVPANVDNGATVPILVSVQPPLRGGDFLRVSVNGEVATELTIEEGDLSGFSFRILMDRDPSALTVDCSACSAATKSSKVIARATLPTISSSPRGIRAFSNNGTFRALVLAASTVGGQFILEGNGLKLKGSLSKYTVSNPLFGFSGSFGSGPHCFSYISEGALKECTN